MKNPANMSAKEVISEIGMYAPYIPEIMMRGVAYIAAPGAFSAMQTPDGAFRVDFSDPENLDIMDRTYLPVIKELVERGDHLGIRTAITQLFTPQGVLAIELGSFSAHDFDELSDHVYMRNGVGGNDAPIPRQDFPQSAVILAFPRRDIA